MARDLPAASEIDWHSHPRFQLIFAVRGVMTVDTREATWLVPPQRAVWMPPAVEHRLTARGVDGKIWRWRPCLVAGRCCRLHAGRSRPTRDE